MKTPQRTDSAFPPPGDPRLLSDIQRRTPLSGDAEITHLPGGIAITPRRVPRSRPSQQQWRITVAANADATTWDATVAPGDTYTLTQTEDSSGFPCLGGGGAITTDPTTLLDLADDTTYGLWLRLKIGTNSVTNGITSGETLALSGPSGSWEVFKDDTQTAAADAANLISASTSNSYVLIGTVTITSGAVSILQNLRGPLTWPPLHHVSII